jgi:hypothetical protein
VNPLNVFRIIANSELRKASEYYEAVQVKPQHVSLKLRISEIFFLMSQAIQGDQMRLSPTHFCKGRKGM